MTNEFSIIRKKALTLHASGAVVLLFLSFIAWFAVIMPAVGKGDEVAELSQRSAAQSADLRRLARVQQQLAAQLATSRQTLEESSIKLLPPGSLNARLAAITDLAGKCGLQIDSITPAAVQSGETLLLHPLQLNGRGSYGTCHSFMRSLRAQLPDTSVQSLSLLAEPGTGSTNATFSITLLWCAKKEPQTTAAIQP